MSLLNKLIPYVLSAAMAVPSFGEIIVHNAPSVEAEKKVYDIARMFTNDSYFIDHGAANFVKSEEQYHVHFLAKEEIPRFLRPGAFLPPNTILIKKRHPHYTLGELLLHEFSHLYDDVKGLMPTIHRYAYNKDVQPSEYWEVVEQVNCFLSGRKTSITGLSSIAEQLMEKEHLEDVSRYHAELKETERRARLKMSFFRHRVRILRNYRSYIFE